MCRDLACDATAPPPPGESWCPRRLVIEVLRWESGHPMTCGQPQPVGLPEETKMSSDELGMDDLPMILEALSPSSLAEALDRDRPYDGQPHTDHGERGRTEVKGITFRDLRDCFIRACYDASGLPVEEWPGSVDDLPWRDMDIIAVSQNLGCWIERYMGVWPNVPRLYPTDPTQGHWCGATLEGSEWTAHEGHCDEPGATLPTKESA